MRILHLSDIHVWRYSWNPWGLLGKRGVGMASLLAGRAKRFRLERLVEVVERARSIEHDHVIISGDLTTTALREEFDDAREGLAPLLTDPRRATVVPGNHDRYTVGSVRRREFERHFGEFMPSDRFPWVRLIDERTAILGLDACRPFLTATGRLPAEQLAEAVALTKARGWSPARLIIANHYPIVAPPAYQEELAKKRLKNAAEARSWLSTLGPHLHCCGHVHAAWAHRPKDWPDHLSVNSGAPLLRDPTGLRPPGFLEITLHDASVAITHHAWTMAGWEERSLIQIPDFFPEAAPAKVGAGA